MNWMIDGVHGDLYRTAMGYRPLAPHNEWEIERNLATRRGLLQRGLVLLRKRWTAITWPGRTDTPARIKAVSWLAHAADLRIGLTHQQK